MSTSLTLSQIRQSFAQEPPSRGHDSRGIYFTHTNARQGSTTHALVTTVATGDQPLVMVRDLDVRALLEVRLSGFGDQFLNTKLLRTLEDEVDKGNQATRYRGGGSWLDNLFAPDAAHGFDHDQPLKVWNPITQQVDEVTAEYKLGEGVMLTLSDATVAGLLRPYYEPLHRALGLDLLAL